MVKSAITDHVVEHNHVMTMDSNKFKRHVRESISIKRRGNKTMYRDECNSFLNIFNQLPVSPTSATSVISKKLVPGLMKSSSNIAVCN